MVVVLGGDGFGWLWVAMVLGGGYGLRCFWVVVLNGVAVVLDGGDGSQRQRFSMAMGIDGDGIERWLPNSHEKEIVEGSVKPDQVFGKDHSECVGRGGRGVTPTKYFNIPRYKGSLNERIDELEKQLDVERQQSESAIEQVKHLSTKIKLEDEKYKQLSATVKEQDLKFDAFRRRSCHQREAVAGEEGVTGGRVGFRVRVLDCQPYSQRSSRFRKEPSNVIMSSHLKSQENENMASQVVPTKDPMTCQLAYSSLRNIVARGRVYYSSKIQTIYGVTLEDNCCIVSIDESVKPTSFLPIEVGERKTVGDAIHSSVAWPNYLVEEPTSSEHAEKQNPKKRKKTYTIVDELKNPKHTRNTHQSVWVLEVTSFKSAPWSLRHEH
ncbi:hypothetical protein OSB04_019574 [Centaurea solstitialis]|uniref:DUF8039 domain-containing protein n=1 Tax=Centaurea solstitialis TaxID=347529 RepID=A0AA38T233_9ASTR|nr:hypothetical protein OSB04_019574 [Centaurea solstitialis]